MKAKSKSKFDTGHAPQSSSIRSLVRIDDVPLRSDASREFTKLYKTYARYTADLEHHEKKVRPSYYHWIAGHFGPQLEHVAELQAELMRKSVLLQRMRELCIFEGFSRRRAFEKAQEEMEFEDAGFEFDAADDDADEELDSESDPFAMDDDALFENGTGPRPEEPSPHSSEEARNEEWFASIRDRFSQSTGESQEDRRSQAKSFYRKLAQALHPDRAGEQTDLIREFWKETQEAYQRLDLDHLKMIWTVVSLQTQALSREMRLFDLRAAITHIKEKLRSVKSEKRRLTRQDPSWSFEKKNRTELARQIRTELEQEESLLRDALEEIDENLAVFSRDARSKTARRADRY